MRTADVYCIVAKAIALIITEKRFMLSFLCLHLVFRVEEELRADSSVMTHSERRLLTMYHESCPLGLSVFQHVWYRTGTRYRQQP